MYDYMQMKITVPKITAILTLCIALQSQSVHAQSTCEIAFSQLLECSMPLTDENPDPAEGCCALLAAFELRDCLNSDPRIEVLGEQVFTSLASLIVNCQGDMFPSGDATMESSDHTSNTAIAEIDDGAMSVEAASSQVIEAIISLAQDAMGKNDPDYLMQQAVLHDKITMEFLEETQETCECTRMVLPVPDGDADWRVKLDYHAQLARLWLCQFTCNHCRLVLGGIMVQMTLLSLWIIVLLAKPRGGSHGFNSRRRSLDGTSNNSTQFVIRASDYAAADLECAQPLLMTEEGDYDSDN